MQTTIKSINIFKKGRPPIALFTMSLSRCKETSHRNIGSMFFTKQCNPAEIKKENLTIKWNKNVNYQTSKASESTKKCKNTTKCKNYHKMVKRTQLNVKWFSQWC